MWSHSSYEDSNFWAFNTINGHGYRFDNLCMARHLYEYILIHFESVKEISW